MNGIIGEFRLGEDVAVALDATAGDTIAVTGVSAMMKPALATGNRFLLDETASGIAMAVAPQHPPSDGWIVSLGHERSLTLAPGIYGIDARLVIGDSVAITGQTAFVRLSRAAVA